MYFYEILENIMEEKSLKVSDVARLSGLADSTIRSILTRKSKSVALEVAFKLSKGLNVSIEQLNGEPVETTIKLNDTEKKLIVSYRNNLDMQPAINKLLDINSNEINQ